MKSFVAPLAVLALVAGLNVQPATADSLSPWGMWGDSNGLKGSKSTPSNLGMRIPRAPVALANGGARPDIALEAPPVVAFSGYEPGTIVIDTAGRQLYYTLSSTEAYAYPIAVGKAGFTWTGVERVSKVVDWPDWIPPDEMRARKPSLPLRMTGGVNNPLGAKAIYLGSTLYRIHGTNDADSIGDAASSGCFRMHNAHVIHLSSLVSADTTVFVLKSLAHPLPKPAPPTAPAVTAEPPEAASTNL